MPSQSRDTVPQPKQPGQAGCLGVIARLTWLAGGNFVLLVLMALIVQERAFSSLDIVFWAVVAASLFISFAADKPACRTATP